VEWVVIVFNSHLITLRRANMAQLGIIHDAKQVNMGIDNIISMQNEIPIKE